MQTRTRLRHGTVASIIAALAFSAIACGHREEPPPPPPVDRVEVIPAPPTREHVWIQGYWVRRGGGDEWFPGHYEHRPREGAEWVRGHYRRTRYGYEYIPGHWR